MLAPWQKLSLKQKIAQLLVVRASGYSFHQLRSSYAGGCIPERLYNDPAVRALLDLPPLELMTEIIEAIADMGWADFKLLLFDIFPEPLQAKILGALWAGFEMDALPAPE